MTTGIRFPVDLPLPSRDYADEDEASRTAFEPEIGTARRRQKYRATPRLFEVSFDFTQAQYAIFDVWWQNTIRGGELPFDVLLLDADETPTWFTVHWVGEYEAEVVGVMDWRVRGTLRAVEGTFGTTRPSGTDELRGIANLEVSARGDLLISKKLRGIASLDVVGTGRLNTGARLFGIAELGIYFATRAKFGSLPLRGLATLDVTGTAVLYIAVVNSYTGESRTWQRMDWFGTGAAEDVSVATTGRQRAWMEDY